MKHLHIDIETYCDVSVTEVGVYRYAEDPSFSIILFAYSWDEGPVEVCEGVLPLEVFKALTDPAILKIAHNANFEITCISKAFDIDLDPRQWFCTMVAAAYLGLPLSLNEISKVLGLSEQKDSRGTALIRFFSLPCSPTKKNDGRLRNLPVHDPERWEEFKQYNAQDVRTEQEIFKYVSRFPGLPETEKEYWILDQLINKNGITIDREFITAAIETNIKFTEKIHDEIVELAGIENPNSLVQLKGWLRKELGHEVHSLSKDYLSEAIDGELLPPHVHRLFELRKMGSKTSISKYDAMLAYACNDDRIRGLFQFYGANRTGRFSGRGVQPQNLKRTLNKGLDIARESVCSGAADLIYDDVADILSRLIRTALVADKDKSLVVSDFAAIEARVIAWLAGEEWVLEVFKTHGKIYEATAANMFKVPIEMVTKENGLRDKGKVSTLALGYQGGVGALVVMGALRSGLDESELPGLVSAWRSANPNIVRLWRQVEDTAKHVVKNKKTYILRKPYCSLKFNYDRGYLFIELPSGRRLSYYGAEVDKGRLSYWGVDQTKKIWTKTDTYGGSLVENITQAVARDCLCDAMLRMYKAGVKILMHIHDEIVAEAPDDKAVDTLTLMNSIMEISPNWAEGLTLKGDGYISKYYKKD